MPNDKLINFLNAAPTPNINSNSAGGLSKLSLYYQNVPGVNSKLIELDNSLISCDCHLVSLSETWLNDSVVNTEVCPDSFEVFRSDRKFEQLTITRGGGVLIAVRNELSVVKLDLSSRGIDMLKTIDIIVGVVDSNQYEVFHCDRNFQQLNLIRGGGAMLLICNSFQCERLNLQFILT